MRAVQVTEFGGPEVLNPVELPDPEPGPGQVLIDVDRIGVNYADTHQAENSYLAPSKLPLVPGAEVVGRTPEGKRVVALLNGGGVEQLQEDLGLTSPAFVPNEAARPFRASVDKLAAALGRSPVVGIVEVCEKILAAGSGRLPGRE